LKYTPNEDGACQPVCPQCTTEYCWEEAEPFLAKRGLDAQTVIELLESDFHLSANSACCARGMIHTFRLEEVLREIDYQRTERFGNGSKAEKDQWGSGRAVDAVLKITTQNDPPATKWKDYFSDCAMTNLEKTVFLFKDWKGHSGLVRNDIRKAYGLARRVDDGDYIFFPNFVASSLITASMRIPGLGICYDWSYINKQPSEFTYSYLLNLDEKGQKWRLEGQRYDHGVFLIDEWEPCGKSRKDYPFVEVYDVLKHIYDGK
jgi:hypothetical protein